MLKNYNSLISKVKDHPKKTVALIGADDKSALEAVINANDIVDSVLIGDKVEIADKLKQLGKKPSDFEIVEKLYGEHPCITAAKLIRKGKVDFLMKGNIQTGDMLSGVLSEESGLRKSKLMTHMAILQIPNYHKLVFLTDSGMCIAPNLNEKKHILINGIEFMNSLGYVKPNIAALCAVEKVSSKMPETVDAETLSKMARDGELPKCNLVGPISYDLAMVSEVSKIKRFNCPYSGDFDMLFAPNMLVGNILGKSLVYTAGGKMAGLILGAKVPIVLTSRGSSAEEKYNSMAIAAGMN